LKRLYEAIENGVINASDPSLKDRIAELSAIRNQAQADAERATAALERLGPAITPAPPCQWHGQRISLQTRELLAGALHARAD